LGTTERGGEYKFVFATVGDPTAELGDEEEDGGAEK
jgi:hypothetical protein